MKEKRMRRNKALKFTASMLLSLIGLFAVGAVFGLFGGAIAAGLVSAVVLPAYIKDNDKLTETEKKMFEALLEEAVTLATKASRGNLNQEYVDGRINEISEKMKSYDEKLSIDGGKSISEYVKTIQDQVDGFEARFKTLNDASNKLKSSKALIHEAVTANHEQLKKSFKEGKPLELKVAIDMSETASLGAGVILEFREPGVTGIAKRMPWLVNLLPTRNTVSPLISWVEVTSEDGTIVPLAEAAKFTQRSYMWERKTAEVKKIPAYGKVTTEMVEDVDQLVSFIQDELLRDLRLALDAQLLSGDGLAANLSGLLTNATALSVPAALKLPTGITPNKWDVIKATINQIVLNNYYPDAILMHPTDVTAMELTRDKDGQYILPPFTSAGGLVVSGINVYQNSGITVDNFVVFDSMRTPVYYKRGIELKLWDQNGEDPIHDMMTMTATVRACLRIKTEEKKAIVKGTFAAGITAMTTV